jgi:hypothetical protein
VRLLLPAPVFELLSDAETEPITNGTEPEDPAIIAAKNATGGILPSFVSVAGVVPPNSTSADSSVSWTRQVCMGSPERFFPVALSAVAPGTTQMVEDGVESTAPPNPWSSSAVAVLLDEKA